MEAGQKKLAGCRARVKFWDIGTRNSKDTKNNSSKSTYNPHKTSAQEETLNLSTNHKFKLYEKKKDRSRYRYVRMNPVRMDNLKKILIAPISSWTFHLFPSNDPVPSFTFLNTWKTRLLRSIFYTQKNWKKNFLLTFSLPSFSVSLELSLGVYIYTHTEDNPERVGYKSSISMVMVW